MNKIANIKNGLNKKVYIISTQMKTDIKNLVKYLNSVSFEKSITEDEIEREIRMQSLMTISNIINQAVNRKHMRKMPENNKDESEDESENNAVEKELTALYLNFELLYSVYKKDKIESFEKFFTIALSGTIIDILSDLRKKSKKNKNFDHQTYVDGLITELASDLDGMDDDNKQYGDDGSSSSSSDSSSEDDTENDDESDSDYDDDLSEEETSKTVKRKRRVSKAPPRKKQRLDTRKMDTDFAGLYRNISMPKNPDQVTFNYFKNSNVDIKEQLLEKIREISLLEDEEEPFIFKLVNLDIPIDKKKDIISDYFSLERSLTEKSKMKAWLRNLVKLPFGKYKGVNLESLDNNGVTTFLNDLKEMMDTSVWGHNEAKDKIVEIMGQYLSNPSSMGSCIGIHGPAGVGKTTLIKEGIAKAMNRPFVFISLGGAQDASFLEGHSFTYEGSIYGRIAQGLMDSECMNPIIYFDELDKISDTHRGQEITNLLIHLIDPAQNQEFNDKYFYNIKLDLSKATFIFSYNHPERVDRILRDRITQIETEYLTLSQKIKICQNYLLPGILKDVGLEENFLKIPDNIMEELIMKYTYEGGVRKAKSILYSIVRQLNILKLTKAKLANRKVNKKVTLNMKSFKELMKNYHHYKPDVIHKKPEVGVINGMWANALGIGGILPIETSWIMSNNSGSIRATGTLGDVIKESIDVANAVAWNVLNDNEKRVLEDKLNNIRQGIHIHCPDGSTPKDGPSAGTAITTVLYSLYTGKKIRNDIAITGEITLRGDVKKIGGLDIKLYNAKKAGIRLALIPEENRDDYEKIVNSDPDFEDEDFEVRLVENIDQVLDLVLV